MGNLTAELAYNNLAGQETTEALMIRLAAKTRPAAFLQGHHEFAAVTLTATSVTALLIALKT